MNIRMLLLAMFAAMSVPAFAAGPNDIDFVVASSLPPDTMKALQGFAQSGGYVLSTKINPFYLRGDFTGDGKADIAVLVKEKAGSKSGIAVVARKTVTVIGAGQALGEGNDDLSWMDAWYVYLKGRVEQGVTDLVPPKLKGDAIMAIKTESASGLIYWGGERYVMYQQAD